jgi:hypothetical protein
MRGTTGWRRRRVGPALRAALLGLLASAAPASAQGPPGKAVDSAACRRRCGAVSPDRAQNPREVQACLLRCGAGERHQARQNRRGTPEATGQGRPAGQAGGAGLAAGVPSIWPPSAGTDPAAAAGRALVAYAGAPPARGIAISPPVERMAAHRGAETECFRRNENAPCRLLAETRERCLAVSMRVRVLGVMATADPRTYAISHYGSGAGPDRAAAEAAAMRDCAARPVPGTSCRIATARCQD